MSSIDSIKNRRNQRKQQQEEEDEPKVSTKQVLSSKYKKQQEEEDDHDNHSDQEVHDSEEEQSKYVRPSKKVSKKPTHEEDEETPSEEEVREPIRRATSQKSSSPPVDEEDDYKPLKSSSSTSSKSVASSSASSSRTKARNEDAPAPTTKRSAGKRSATKVAFEVKTTTQAEYSAIPDKIIKGILKANLDSFSSECIDQSKELLARIVYKILSNSKSSQISSESICNFMNQYIAEEHLKEEVYIQPNVFVKFLAPLEHELQVKCRRDAYYMLQMYAESFLIKLISLSKRIAENTGRSRVQGSHLELAYEIRMN